MARRVVGVESDGKRFRGKEHRQDMSGWSKTRSRSISLGAFFGLAGRICAWSGIERPGSPLALARPGPVSGAKYRFLHRTAVPEAHPVKKLTPLTSLRIDTNKRSHSKSENPHAS